MKNVVTTIEREVVFDRLGGREFIAIVERYTRSVRFEDSLKLYSAIVG